MRLIGAALLLIGGLGCAGPLMRPVEEELPPPGPQEARVVIYRPSLRNAGHDYAVFDGETLVGFAQSGRRFEYRCSPGPRLFYLQGTHDAAVQATLDAGRTYFLRAGEQPGWFKLLMTLEPMAFPEAETEVRGCDRMELDPWRSGSFQERRGPEAAARVAFYRDSPAECRTLDSSKGRPAGDRP